MQLSFVALKVLKAFVASTDRRWHGYALVKETDTEGPTIYPLLRRMAEERILSADWESTEIKRRKCHYSITPQGAALARNALIAVQMPQLLCTST